MLLVRIQLPAFERGWRNWNTRGTSDYQHKFSIIRILRIELRLIQVVNVSSNLTPCSNLQG